MRSTVLANGEVYHVFNRGIERKIVFRTTREYKRALLTLDFYRFHKPHLRLAKVLILEKNLRKEFYDNLYASPRIVDLISFCIMPNHFHFLLKQAADSGISRFVSNFTNSYTKYINTKIGRVGPLFQGTFKAVRIETDEQLIHVSRYIHINPVVSFIIKVNKLGSYTWSSLPEYLSGKTGICEKAIVLSKFSSLKKYERFVFDQIDYARKLDKVKYLVLE